MSSIPLYFCFYVMCPVHMIFVASPGKRFLSRYFLFSLVILHPPGTVHPPGTIHPLGRPPQFGHLKPLPALLPPELSQIIGGHPSFGRFQAFHPQGTTLQIFSLILSPDVPSSVSSSLPPHSNDAAPNLQSGAFHPLGMIFQKTPASLRISSSNSFLAAVSLSLVPFLIFSFSALSSLS